MWRMVSGRTSPGAKAQNSRNSASQLRFQLGIRRYCSVGAGVPTVLAVGRAFWPAMTPSGVISRAAARLGRRNALGQPIRLPTLFALLAPIFAMMRLPMFSDADKQAWLAAARAAIQIDAGALERAALQLDGELVRAVDLILAH